MKKKILKKPIWVSKNAEFYAYFKCGEMDFEKMFLKSYGQNTLEKSAKSNKLEF